ncbi:hypothetical protein O3M35_000351 [Rhynocoris fuscipes]|uniref:Uncharacterized protein n=1 Tax=Rhynocoris fuscipes TaxID=488301 RepID=A0AAW1DND7_9HEMI
MIGSMEGNGRQKLWTINIAMQKFMKEIMENKISKMRKGDYRAFIYERQLSSLHCFREFKIVYINEGDEEEAKDEKSLRNSRV